MTDWKAKFPEIKRAYAEVMPEWYADYERTGNMVFDPYLRDWPSEFTPIEYSVWQDIRGHGLDFYPQFPACGYFLDFANPFKRIAIECDGAAYHDAEKDAKRDAELELNGWKVFRISGRECNNLRFYALLETPKAERELHDVRDWLVNSSDGIVYSISKVCFPRKGENYEDHEYGGLILESILLHLTTSQGWMDG